jgi:hypothetical protein
MNIVTGADMRTTVLLTCLAALALPAGAAAAQDMSATPISGSVSRSYGFSPDPYTVNVTAGGSIQASSVSSECSGTISNSPDFEFTYSAGGGYPLVFRSSSSADTTLLINGPDGRWYCDDDTNGLDPEVRFIPAESGTYDIWIGSYSGRMESAVLSISEINNGGSSGQSGGEAPNAGLAATYGSRTLYSGFTPDPYTVSVTSGGPLQAASVGSGCTGTIARAPDFELTYTAGSLPLIFRTLASTDTTLVINGPNGSWFCDDDSAGQTNAEVRFSSPQSGVYDVWVGSYSGPGGAATLQITEIGSGDDVGGPTVFVPAPPPVVTPAPPSATSTLMPDAGMTATYGEINLRSGFTPDPRRIPLRAGGPVPAANASDGCRGSIARAPDYQITYTAGRQPLIVRTESATDTTLVINDPDGVWHCDDDSRGEGNAEVHLDKPSAGVYDIWVGTFGGGTAAATLILTERP